MSYYKKRIWLLLLLINCLAASFVFAQETTASKCQKNPPVCLATPSSMNLYLEFQHQIIGLLESNPFETVKETIHTPNGGLFTNRLLTLSGLETYNDSLPSQVARILGTATENLIISNTTALTLFLASSLTAIHDGLFSFLILFHDRPIVRDRSKLIDIDWRISTTILQLGSSGKIVKTIKNSEKLNTLIQIYTEKGLFANGSAFRNNVSYIEVLTTLSYINMTVKNFLAAKTLEEDRKQGAIRFKETRTQKMNEEYACTRRTFGLKCNPSFRNIRDNIQQLRSNTATSAKTSKHIISTATEKLKKAIKGFSQFQKKRNSTLTEEEKELLREVYGIDTTRLTDLEQQSILGFTQRTKNHRAEAKSDLNDGLEQAEKQRKQLYKTTKDVLTNTSKNKTKEIEITIKNQQNPELYKALVEGFQNWEKAEREIMNTTDLNDTLLLSSQFGILSHQIQTIANVIGDKGKGIRKEVNEICLYQCSNKPLDTCFIN